MNQHNPFLQFSLQGWQGIFWLLLLLALLYFCRKASLQKLVLLTAFLILDLIMFGAYVRISDAGLGCPDWPGCFASFTPLQAKQQIEQAVQIQGGEWGPVSHTKAWIEMLHRYWASVVGALILLITWRCWRDKNISSGTRRLAWLSLIMVLLQGLFGKWTVTLKLMPLVVTLHLLGALILLGLLVALAGKFVTRPLLVRASTASLAWLALALLLVQIALGGWTSSNYAGLACTGYPTCNGQWLPDMQLDSAFSLVRKLGYLPDGSLLTMQALVGIAWVHRWFAWLVVLAFWLLAKQLRPHAPKLAWWLFALPIAQVLLGISNVWWSLPVLLAVAHNGLAAIMFGLLVHLLVRLKTKPS